MKTYAVVFGTQWKTVVWAIHDRRIKPLYIALYFLYQFSTLVLEYCMLTGDIFAVWIVSGL